MEEIEAISSLLNGCREILEIGIGAGKMAVPLMNKDINIMGADTSLRMV